MKVFASPGPSACAMMVSIETKPTGVALPLSKWRWRGAVRSSNQNGYGRPLWLLLTCVPVCGLSRMGPRTEQIFAHIPHAPPSVLVTPAAGTPRGDARASNPEPPTLRLRNEPGGWHPSPNRLKAAPAMKGELDAKVG